MTSAPPATPVVDVQGLGRQFGSDPPVQALRDATMRVERGEWLSIIGPSGSGKSTLLNIIGCLDVQTSGRYVLDGIEVAALSDRERAGLRSQAIGFVFQTFHMLNYRTVLENVMLAEVYRKHSREGRAERATAALERVGLAHRSGFLPSRLSGGERQRVAIARAIMGSPALLLCDEPTGNLDSVTGSAIMGLLSELHRQGLTIIMITHDSDIAAQSERRVRIVDGVLSEVA